MLDAAAGIAAALHSSGLALGPRRELEDELAAHGERIAFVERISPDMGGQLRVWLARIAESAAASASLPLAFNHGDFTFGQILFDGPDSGLIDFDSVCQAEPALDLGHFLTYVHLASQKSKLDQVTTAALIDQLSDRFLSSYLKAAAIAPPNATRLRKRVEIYQASSMLRRTVRSWQKFKVSRIEGALAALEAAIARLS
jgi:aminoglycoside phosphotransferase (APT) family kinase protein